MAERRRISVTVGTSDAVFALFESESPEAADALWDTLPIEGELVHGKWSGSACWTKTDRAPLTGLDRLECPVSSVYPGMLVLRTAAQHGGLAELLFSYGVAECRTPVGRNYGTLLGEVVEGQEQLFAALASTWTGTTQSIRITRA